MKKNGAVLVLTLWVLTFLSAIAIGITYRMGLELKMIKYGMDRTKAYYAAKAGLAQITSVLNEESGGYDSLGEKWSNYSEEVYGRNPFKDIRVGEGRFNVCYIYSTDIFSGRQQKNYGMYDEERKININKATQDMLESLGINPEVATSIRAWRGDGSVPQDVNSKEDLYYKTLEKPYERKGKDIQNIEELALVRGITPELLFGKDINNNGVIETNESGLLRYLTVFGDGRINVNTADEAVLRAVLSNSDLCYRIIRYRLGVDEIIGTEDDRVFTDEGRIAADLANSGEQLLPEEEKILNDKKGLLKVTSRYYTAEIEGRVGDKVKVFIQVTLDRDAEEGNQIVKWIE